jgi:hypothetical protein
MFVKILLMKKINLVVYLNIRISLPAIIRFHSMGIADVSTRSTQLLYISFNCGTASVQFIRWYGGKTSFVQTGGFLLEASGALLYAMAKCSL